MVRDRRSFEVARRRRLAFEMAQAGKTLAAIAAELGLCTARVSQLLHEPQPASAADGCIHHWLIASPKGPRSDGVCQKCGDRRNFENVGPMFTGQWSEGLAHSALFQRSEFSGVRQ
jgi:hypothetical protein